MTSAIPQRWLVTADTVAALVEAIHGPEVGATSRLHDDVFGAPPGGEPPGAPLRGTQVPSLGRLLGSSTDSGTQQRLLARAMIEDSGMIAVLTAHFGVLDAVLAEDRGRHGVDRQRVRDDLACGAVIGAAALSEHSAWDPRSQRTTATWDRDRGEFVLSTPDLGATKRTAHPERTGIVVTVARMIVDGLDHGPRAFLVRLRDRDGALLDGVELITLMGSGDEPSPTVIEFTDLRLPPHALLGARHHADRTDAQPPAVRAIGDRHRLDTSTAAAAAARAALVGVVDTESATAHAHLDIETALEVALTYALSAFVRAARAPATHDSRQVMAALTAHLLPEHARRVIDWSAARFGSDANPHIRRHARWLAALDTLQRHHGRWWGSEELTETLADIDLDELTLPAAAESGLLDGLGTVHRLCGRYEQLPVGAGNRWWMAYLEYRVDMLQRLSRGCADTADLGFGRRAVTAELATATAERLAATALHAASARTPEPTARLLLEAMADVYALHCIRRHAGWYAAHNRYRRKTAVAIVIALRANLAKIAAHLPTLTAAFTDPPRAFPTGEDSDTATADTCEPEHIHEPGPPSPTHSNTLPELRTENR
ncbi:acyl-CoA dehydrogenase [Nocardia takedensis]|uniref:acyl-CoA dehydrogenase n=1 Tax=Nocardia takedensis TaxID=259390 RepID=UPI00030CA43D|nr:acyl-CoA dehydrogenase [Nocardia takedensis]